MKYEEYQVIVYENGDTKWLQNGKLNRLNGPALEYSNGDKYWYKNGYLHRDGGPTITLKNGGTLWYKNGLLHRLDGPAVFHTSGYKAWYIEGRNYSEKEFLQKTSATSCTDKVIKIDGKTYKLIKI